MYRKRGRSKGRPLPLGRPTRRHAGRGLVYALPMGTVHEIEAAISKLSRQELLALRDWFSQFDSAAWDKQFEEDVAGGRLDGFADEALADLRAGLCREM